MPSTAPGATGAKLVTVAPAGQQLWRNRPVSGLSSAVLTVQTQLNRAAAEPGGSAWRLDAATWAAALREYADRHRTG